MKVLRTIKAIALVAVFMLTATAALAEFEYHGYARGGRIYNSDLHVDSALPLPEFQNKGAGRLGQEADWFAEHNFVNTWMNEDGTWAKYSALICTNISSLSSSGGWVTPDAFVVRNAYVSMGGFAFAKDASFWAGQRYYGRQDVHIVDYFITDYASQGLGVENVAGMVDFAILNSDLGAATNQNKDKTVVADGSRLNAYTFNLRVRPMKGLMIELAPVLISGDATYKDSNGYEAAINYNPDGFFFFAKGSSVVNIRYSKGLTGLGGAGNITPANRNELYGKGSSEEQIISLVLAGLLDAGSGLSIAPFINVKQTKLTTSDKPTTAIRAVLRPHYDITSGLAAELEGGLCYYMDADKPYMDSAAVGKQKAVASSYAVKITPALIIQAAPGFYTRPQIKLFANYAMWSSKQTVDAQSTLAAWNFGWQFESWW